MKLRIRDGLSIQSIDLVFEAEIDVGVQDTDVAKPSLNATFLGQTILCAQIA